MKKKRSTEIALKETKSKDHPIYNRDHPVLTQKLSLGQRSADWIASFGGSWKFITLFLLFIALWISINAWFLSRTPFDPYPFILMNLVLSMLAALQAPVILMSQNRQAERDRIDAKYDHAVNRKAEREVQQMQRQLASIRVMLHKMHSRELREIDTEAEQVLRVIKKE